MAAFKDRCDHDVADWRVLREVVKHSRRDGRETGTERDVGCLRCGATWREHGRPTTVKAADPGDQGRIAILKAENAGRARWR